MTAGGRSRPPQFAAVGVRCWCQTSAGALIAALLSLGAVWEDALGETPNYASHEGFPVSQREHPWVDPVVVAALEW